MKQLIAILTLVAWGNGLAYGYTFGEYATDAGLTGDETYIRAGSKGITVLAGLANNYDNLTELYLYYNQITSIENGDFDGLTNLIELNLGLNQIASIETGDFAGLTNLNTLSLYYNRIASIENGDFGGLTNLTLLNLLDNQITRIESGSFRGLTNLTHLYLADNIGLNGADVVALLSDLDSLKWLWVDYYDWDIDIKNQLLAWDAIEGHTLMIPEPCTLALVAFGGLALRRRRKA